MSLYDANMVLDSIHHSFSHFTCCANMRLMNPKDCNDM